MIEQVQEAEISRLKSAYERRMRSGCDRRYAISERGNLLRMEELQHRMLSLIAGRFGSDLSSKRILEVGCGTGYWLRQLIQWGARPGSLFGIDLLADRIASARELCPKGVYLECQDASTLGFGEATFDLVLQLTVFTSILDPAMKTAIAREILRVLKPSGCMLWYDFFIDNPSNRDVRGVSKREIQLLFPGCSVRLERMTLAPPLGRIIGKVSPWAYRVFSAMNVLCTHYIGLVEMPSEAQRKQAQRDSPQLHVNI